MISNKKWHEDQIESPCQWRQIHANLVKLHMVTLSIIFNNDNPIGHRTHKAVVPLHCQIILHVLHKTPLTCLSHVQINVHVTQIIFPINNTPPIRILCHHFIHSLIIWNRSSVFLLRHTHFWLESLAADGTAQNRRELANFLSDEISLEKHNRFLKVSSWWVSSLCNLPFFIACKNPNLYLWLSLLHRGVYLSGGYWGRVDAERALSLLTEASRLFQLNYHLVLFRLVCVVIL